MILRVQVFWKSFKDLSGAVSGVLGVNGIGRTAWPARAACISSMCSNVVHYFYHVENWYFHVIRMWSGNITLISPAMKWTCVILSGLLFPLLFCSFMHWLFNDPSVGPLFWQLLPRLLYYLSWFTISKGLSGLEIMVDSHEREDLRVMLVSISCWCSSSTRFSGPIRRPLSTCTHFDEPIAFRARND